jgi:hypothetical protein
MKKQIYIAAAFLVLSSLVLLFSFGRQARGEIFNPSQSSGGSSSTSTTVVNTSSSPVLVSLATLLAGEDLTDNVLDVELHYAYTFIATANSTTTIKSAAGFIHTITVDNPNGSSTINVYDSTSGSGTQIAQFVLPTSTAMPQTLTLDDAFTTGLTIQEKGNTSTITVSSR